MSDFAPPAVILRRHVPNDHECVFTAVAYLCEGSTRTAGQRLRAVCAAKIASDPDTYSEALLGMDNAAYCKWITNPLNWGGEVELGILAAHFGVELCVVSMEAFYVLPFPMGDKGRAYLLYTGQHYDPLVGAASEDSPVGEEIKLFPAGSDAWDAACIDCARAQAVIAAANASRRVVKKIKCNGCGTVVDDPEGFKVHCEEFEHDDDFCYDCEEVTVVEEGDEAVPEGRIDLTSPDVVAFYNTESAPLSNLHPSPLLVGGRTYPTAEHFWLTVQFTSGPVDNPVAAGTPDEAVADALCAAPVEALNVVANGFSSSERTGWFSGTGGERLAALKAALQAKFTQHPTLAAELAATGAKTLVLVDADRWSGMSAAGGIPTGKNRVGEALMELREALGGAAAEPPRLN